MALLHLLAALMLAQTATRPGTGGAVQARIQDVPAEAGQATPQDAAPEAEQATDQQPQPEPENVAVQAPPPDPGPVAVRPVPYYPTQAFARQATGDPRIRLLAYDPDRIVTLGVGQGFASIVELAEDERVENLVVGNSAAWQVTANRRGDRVIVKPLPGAAPSNMIVLTASRRYIFMLDPYAATSFIIRFSYPQPVLTAAAAVAPETTYKMRGAKALFPLAMYDDARQTVIRWSAQHPLPAVFALNGSTERLVEGQLIGDDFVIQGASPRYKFRYGGAEATAIRQTRKRPR